MGTGSVQVGLESLFLEGRGETLQSLCCGDCTVSLLAGNRKSYLHHKSYRRKEALCQGNDVYNL